MKIKSIRYGFANNSSSSHSIVFMGDYKIKDENHNYDHYGSNDFTLASEIEKKKYLLSNLLSNNFVNFIPRTPLTEKTGWTNPFDKDQVEKKYNLSYKELPETKHGAMLEYGEDIIEKVKKDYIFEVYDGFFSKELIKDAIENRVYVDHQSIIYFPRDLNGLVNNKFVKELFSVIIKENFAILGGSDGGDHSLSEFATSSKDESVIAVLKILDFMNLHNSSLCVYDEENDDFVLQSIGLGDKMRISFNSDSKTTKSSIPELVDLKITDNCNYNCKFCYQSSTKEGKHADFENIKKVISILSNSKTMEIAIGGGEPTNHPDLLEILQEIRKKNMLACFTTKNFKLHERPDFEEIIKTANSIAFSCNSFSEIEKVKIIIDYCRDKSWYFEYSNVAKIYIQIIPELMTDKLFNDSMEYIGSEMYNIPVTLLGYKDFGFGENYKPNNRFSTPDWIDVVKHHSKENYVRFGIDSVLVSKWEDELIERGVDPMALVGKEGKFSCYLDAVKMSIHKSSFSKEPGIQLTGEEKDVKKEFATF